MTDGTDKNYLRRICSEAIPGVSARGSGKTARNFYRALHP